jgi:tetratricopeptide (TPR) repeat protein
VMLTGLVVCGARFLRRQEAGWFVLLGTAFAVYGALFYLSLEVPYYCDVKAFYALMSLLPMCAFGAAGWETLTRMAGRLRPALYVAALVWAMNAYASLWIRGWASATHTMRGNWYGQEGRTAEALAELTEALRINPHDVSARRFMAQQLAHAGDLEGAWQETELLLAEEPDNADGLLQSALLLAGKGQMEQAKQRARRAIEVAPDYALAYQELGACEAQAGNYKETAEAAREGLRITPFSAKLHDMLAFSLASLGEYVEADGQFQIVLELKPDWPEAHDQFGFALAAQKDWEAAIRQFAEACRLQPNEAKFQKHLAQAQAEAARAN